ncbi:MAG: hypothetical protein IKS48_03955 [Eubacterium sp.]|nr:hypothetical protein [Eubacterium sp.]
MWERLKFWMMGYKDCAGCCLGCSFFDECREDVFGVVDAISAQEREMYEREAYERDLVIESIMRKRMPERYQRKSA